jgi:hypothetical protein
MTYTLIAHTELGSAAARIEFTSIPQTFTDLLLVFSMREASFDNVAANIRINGALVNLSERFLFGSGTSVGSSSGSEFNTYVNYNSSTANTFGNGMVYIPNYASTTTTKSLSNDSVSENNGSTAYMRIGAGLFNSTTAISSVGIQTVGGNVAALSSATLYGITAGSSGGVVVS